MPGSGAEGARGSCLQLVEKLLAYSRPAVQGSGLTFVRDISEFGAKPSLFLEVKVAVHKPYP